MRSNDKETLRRMMAEAALLSPDDSKRREAEALIAGEASWAEREWFALLEEDESLRLDLQRVPVPSSLKKTLLAIPEERRLLRISFPRLRRGWALAAAFSICVSVVVGVHFLTQPADLSAHLNTLALLAMSDHVEEHPLDVMTTSPVELAGRLKEIVSFRILFPNMGPEFALLGGRKCVLGSQPVVFSRWNGPEGEVTLIQFDPADFSLPDRLARQTIKPEVPAARRHPCVATIWVQEGRGYVRVADAGSGPSGENLP
jgi:hypothetical protein